MILKLLLRPTTYIKLAIAGASLAIMLGFLGAIHPAFDTIAHSRLYFAIALLFAFLVMLLVKHFISSAIAFVFGIIGLIFSASGLPIDNSQPELEGEPIYSMFHLNLLFSNKEQQKAVARIRELDPELISLTEASPLWDEKLSTLIDDWPYLYHCPEHHKRGGVKIYSKWPMQTNDAYCGIIGSVALIKVSAPDGSQIDIGSVHTRWPWPASGPRQVLNAKPRLETLGNDALIAGDFNSTPWSLNLRNFASYGSLEIVSGIGPSWMFKELPEWLIPIIGLPIDQVMYKGRIHIVQAKTLSAVGSDHLPVLIRFQLKD